MKLIVKLPDNEKPYVFESLFKKQRYLKEIIHTKTPVEVSPSCYKMEDTVTIIDTYSFDIPIDKLVFASLLLKHLDKNGLNYCFKLEDEEHCLFKKEGVGWY